MASTYKGMYNPINKQKYSGTLPIIYRSSWELAFCKWLDENENVIAWGSESVIIPYYIQNIKHRYFIDFIIKFSNGKILLIEIKPKKQTVPPKKSKTGRITRRYLEEEKTFIKNQLKWTAAKEWAKNHNCEFYVWTQDYLRNYLGIKIIT